MKTLFKISAIVSLCLCCIAKSTFAQETEKVIRRSFEASRGHTLDVENKYGNIRVKTWNKNEIDFEIKISVEKSNRKEAEEILSKIDVVFNQSGKTVSAKTTFEKNFQCNNCRLSVEYNILAPDGLNYVIDNKYGNVDLPDVKGNSQLTVKYGHLKASDFYGSTNTFDVKYGNMYAGTIEKGTNRIDVKYGNLDLKKIIDGDNTIDVKYGDAKMDELGGKTNMSLAYNGNVNIGETDNVKIEIKYSSKISVGSGKDLVIESRYSNFNIGKIDGLKLISKNDNYNFGKIGNLNAECSYTNLIIGDITNSLNISDIKYGDIKIGKVSAGFDFIKVNANYTGVRLSFDSKAAYGFDVSARYSNVKTPTNANISKTETERNSKRVSGSVGGSSKSKVDITSGYGDVILN